MKIALWVVQALLAAAFLSAGIMKSTAPLEQLAQQMPWVSGVPGIVTRIVGVAEFLGALGLLLPSITRIKPQLTPLAAAGLALVMVLAAGLHITRGEYPAILFNSVLGGLALFVVVGRTKIAPIPARA